MRKNYFGFGIIEIIIAISIFIIIAGVATASIIGSLSINRLGEEETNANVYAQEGIEAIRSIKNQSWANITTGTYGVDNSTGKWVLSGTSNSSAKFTRQIKISAVERDGGGNIVSSGGVIDPDTMKIDSIVAWDFLPGRNNSITLTAYLSHWEMSIPTPSPTPTGTPTPTPSPTPANCNQYCQATFGLPGACIKKANCTGRDAGKIYECTGANVCCCQ